MCKLLGKRKKLLTAFLSTVVLFSAVSDASCQTYVCYPVIASVSPPAWDAGKTTHITVVGANFYDPSGNSCFIAWLTVTENTGLVSLSKVNVVSPRRIEADVTVPSTVPTETACVGVNTYQTMVVRANASAPSNASTGAACTAVADESVFPVQIVNSGPTITSVTPPAWWASRKQDITITGTNFLMASDQDGPTKLTVKGSTPITLTNVTVVSATEITATVEPAKDEPAETVTLTVTNPAKSSSPGSATASPAPVVLPVPILYWRSQGSSPISGDGAKTQKVKTGQPVELTTTPTILPGGFTVTGIHWIVPGTNVKSFSHPNSGIALTETQTDQLNTTYYWLYRRDGMSVTYTYCATDPNGNELCESPEAKAVFNAEGPSSATLGTDDSQLALVQELDNCGEIGGTAPYLEYGNLSGPAPGCGDDNGDPGIRLTASGASPGSYVFVQIVDFDLDEYTHATGASPTNCGAHAGLDKAFPFPGVEKRNPSVAYDGPQMVLTPNALTGTRTFHASLYLLWQPGQLHGTSTPSIPVPLGYQNWQFIATAVQNEKGKWERHGVLTASGDEDGGFEPTTPYDNSVYGYPIWTQLASTACGVSQEVQ